MLLQDKHIFIVEDNLENRVIFTIALSKYGAAVDFERSGRDVAIALRRHRQVDLILLDLNLTHHISGFDVCDELRALPEFASVPIIAVSAMDPAIAIPEARRHGFTGFIAKPIDAHRFPLQIASILDGEQVWSVGERQLL